MTTTPPELPQEQPPGRPPRRPPDPPVPPFEPDAEPSTVARLSSPQVVQELRGDLPCVKCRYNLKGVTVRGNCPECGTPVRVTILARVDPYAIVLRPISIPWLTAIGLVLWAVGPIVAAITVAVMRTRDLAGEVLGTARTADVFPMIGTLGIIASALGSIALIRPHGGIATRNSLAAALGTLSTLAAAALFWRLHAVVDPTHFRPYIQSSWILAERAWLRLAIAAAIGFALVALRPNARLLASRSILMRLGRVDRQTMLAMLGALAVAALGDGLHLYADSLKSQSASLITAGTVLIALGSLMLVVGFLSILADILRLLPAITRQPLSYSQLVTPRTSDKANP